MPDGRSLNYYHKIERERANAPASARRGRRGKDDVWAQLRGKVASSDHDAAELRVLQEVGSRRRLRWWNDKLLRCAAALVRPSPAASRPSSSHRRSASHLCSCAGQPLHSTSPRHPSHATLAAPGTWLAP
jgi:hypothetical protein